MPTKSKNPQHSSRPSVEDRAREVAQPLDTSDDMPAWAKSDGEPSTDVAEGQVIDGTIVAARRAAEWVTERGYKAATRDLVGYIAGRAIDTSDLNTVILEQMALRLAAAETAADILDPFGTVQGKAILGKPLWVTGAEFLESDLAEGFPWYVSFSVLDRQSNRSTVVTVGGEKLVLQAAELDRKKLWPTALAIHETDKPTKAGFYPLELRPIRM